MDIFISEFKKKPGVFAIIVLTLLSIPLTVFLAVTNQLLTNRAQELPSVSVTLAPPETVNLNDEFVVDIIITSVSDRVLYATIDIVGLTPYFEIIDIIPTAPYTTYQSPPYGEMPIDFSTDFYSEEAINQLPVGTFKIGSLILRAKQLGTTGLFVNRDISEAITYSKYPDGRVVYALNPISTAPYSISILEPGTILSPTPTALPLSGQRFYLVPEKQIVSVGSAFDVEVWINTDGLPVRNGDVVLQYDAAKLQPTTITTGGSGNARLFFPDNFHQIISPGVMYIGGTVTTPNDTRTGIGILATIQFQTLQAGTASVSFDCTPGKTSDTNIGKNDSYATDIVNCAALVNGNYTITQAGGATPTPIAIAGPSLQLSPATQTVAVNSEFTVNVLLNTDGRQTSGTDLAVSYDRTKISLLDIQPGTLYDQYVGKSIDNATGKATISGISSSSQTVFGGTGNFAVLRFRTLTAGVAPVTLEFTQGNRNDSNIADFATQQDILAGVINGAYTITQTGAVTPTPITISGPSLQLSPSSQTVGINAEFSVNVVLNTDGRQTAGTDLLLTYDSSALSLLDMQAGTLYDQYVGKNIDNATGKASLSGISSSPNTVFAGTGTFATLRFRALRTGTAPVSIDFTPGNRNDSNIADFATQQDILAGVINGTYTITQTGAVTPTPAIADAVYCCEIRYACSGGSNRVTAYVKNHADFVNADIVQCTFIAQNQPIDNNYYKNSTCTLTWNPQSACINSTPTRPVGGVPNPTSTPRPTVTKIPTPTPTVPKQTVGILKFKVKFQGVELANIADIANTTQKVRVVVVKQVVDQTSKVVQTISSTGFTDVVVRTTGETDQNGIALWEGQVEIYDFLVGNEYSLLIKGPKHLQKKFCQNNPQEQLEQGLPYRCVEKGKLTIKEGINTFDFSGVLLQAGDLPTNQGLQDGIINLHDVSALLNTITDGINTVPENLIIADIDLNGVINVKDRSYLIETLEEKYGDEE